MPRRRGPVRPHYYHGRRVYRHNYQRQKPGRKRSSGLYLWSGGSGCLVAVIQVLMIATLIGCCVR